VKNFKAMAPHSLSLGVSPKFAAARLEGRVEEPWFGKRERCSWVLCVLGKWKGLSFLLEDEEAAISPLGHLEVGSYG
jgi:hypothetical protein